MKTLLAIITFLIFSANGLSQEQQVGYRVNGVQSQTTLSKSQKNLLTIEGSGCQTYAISASGISIKKTDEGYELVPSKIKETAFVFVSCGNNNKMTVIGRIEFTLVE